MQQVLVSNRSRPQISPVQAGYCESFLCQLKGLTFKRSLAPEKGLLLVQKADSRLNTAIHMIFVLVDLSVVWIDSAYNVVDIRLARRWRPVYIPGRPAKYVLELCADRIDDFRVGELVEFHPYSGQ